MLEDIPSASERCKLCDKYNKSDKDSDALKKKIYIVFDHYKNLLSQWAHATDASIMQRKDITIPVLKDIESSQYDEIKKVFESKGYFIKNDGVRFTVSTVSHTTKS